MGRPARPGSPRRPKLLAALQADAPPSAQHLPRPARLRPSSTSSPSASRPTTSTTTCAPWLDNDVGGHGRRLRPDAVHYLGDPHSRLPRHRPRHHHRHPRRHAGSPRKDRSAASPTDSPTPSTPRPWPGADDDRDVLELPGGARRAGRPRRRGPLRGPLPGAPLPAGRRRRRPVRAGRPGERLRR